jgi:putative nucleotidyltransferase with HDIG domain
MAWTPEKKPSALQNVLNTVDKHSVTSKHQITNRQAPAVLVVEDDVAMREYLGEALAASGFVCNSFGNTAAALSYLASAQESPALVLSDINMPGMSGLEFLRTVRAVTPDLPFILISGLCELSTAMDAMRAGASDYLLKPARREDIARLVAKHITGMTGLDHSAMSTALAGILNARRLSGGDPASKLTPLLEILGLNRMETLQHSQRVSEFSRLIGLELGLDTQSLETLELGALLHDIGKAGIPHNVLMKPSALDENERRIMKMHPAMGRELLSPLAGAREEAEIVYSHHEHFNGQGYPRGLQQEEIHIGARVFAIADTLDAILSNRPYRQGREIGVAREEISRLSGRQFDPKIVRCFDRVSDDRFAVLRDRFKEKVEPTL